LRFGLKRTFGWGSGSGISAGIVVVEKSVKRELNL
jgi:hypothetical protein